MSLASFLFLAAAVVQAPSPSYPGTTLRDDDLRVGAVAYRLASKGASLCPDKLPLTGLLFHHLGEYRPEDRPVMISRYGLDRGPGLLAVIGGSPAEAAGLRAG